MKDLTESSLAVRFFSLAHELGHVAIFDEQPLRIVEEALRQVQEEWTDFDDAERERLLRSLTPADSNPPAASRLIGEIKADAFAFNLLFAASVRLFGETKDRGAIWDTLVVEVVVQFFVMWLMERCHSAVRMYGDTASEIDDDFTAAPVAIRSLLHTLINVMVLTVAGYLERLSDESIRTATREEAIAPGNRIEAVQTHVSDRLEPLQKEFAWFGKNLLEAFDISPSLTEFFELLGRATQIFRFSLQIL